jgi:transaldolase
MTTSIEDLKIKIFADGADLTGMLEMHEKPYIKGLTTNPTLMRKAGIADYKSFAIEVLSQIKEKPISFEVFSDELSEMKRQGLEISSWGENVYVKVPVTNTKGESTGSVVEFLSSQGVKVNVTAIMTSNQVDEVLRKLDPSTPSYISVFAGRVADTGRDPLPIMEESISLISKNLNCELIWASPRELLNVIQAEQVGCQIITATTDILRKLEILGKDLEEYSLETVKMFYEDAIKAGYQI